MATIFAQICSDGIVFGTHGEVKLMIDIYKESHVHKYGDISSDAVIMRMMLLNLKLELFTMK